MKIKYLMAFIVIASLLFTTGCEGDNSGPSLSDPFIGGTTGLTLSFIDGAPPEGVQDNGGYPFTVVLKVENKGESDVAVGDATFKISGIDASDFGTNAAALTQTNNEEIFGTKKNPEGGITEGNIIHLTFPKDSEFNYLNSLSGNHDFPFLATACYKYENKANIMLCVKENPLDNKESVCKVSEIKTVHNSGGPIQIMNFKESARGKEEVAFTFDILHRGTGKFYELSSLCDNDLRKTNKVYVEIETGIPGLECTGLTGGSKTSGYVSLFEGKRSITCTQDISSASGDYEKVIEIITKYDYEQEIRTNVLVKHAPN